MDTTKGATVELTIDDLHRLFHQAYTSNASSLKAHARNKLQNPAMSDDLVQTTFMKTWLYVRRGGKINEMRAFLYHILNDLITDEYRKKKNLSLDQLMDNGYEPGIDYTSRLYNSLDGKGAISQIKKLPYKYRIAIRMRYVNDFSLSEMATKTGKSKNVMAVNIHRGIGKMKIICNANDCRFQ